MIWAYSNLSRVGAFTSKHTDYGYYFTWADAQSACPYPWRLPTLTEINTLLGGTYTTQYSTGSGMMFTLRSDPSKLLFFPWPGYRASGNGSGASATNSGGDGRYWSSDTNASFADTAWFMFFQPSAYPSGAGVAEFKTFGFSVRCVR